MSEIDKTIEPVYLKLLENRKEILSSYEYSERKLNALLLEEFTKALGEITINTYNKYKTNQKIISKASDKYRDRKEFRHIGIELVNMKQSLQGNTPRSVQIPDFLTRDYALLIYEKTLAAVCDSMKEAITEKCNEMGKDIKSFIPLMNSNADIMVDVNNKYYPLVSIRHLQLYEEYKITGLELQTALRLYASSDPYYTDKLDYMNSKYKKEMGRFTGNVIDEN